MTLRELEAKWRERERVWMERYDRRVRQDVDDPHMLEKALTIGKCADELASTLKGMTCATCVHGRGMSQPEAMNDEPRCCHPSEAHPLHWQETSPSFGCMDWAACPDLEKGRE